MKHSKLLCLGDSLTEGFNIPEHTRWTHLLICHDALNIDVVNAGISGDTTAGMLSRCERLIKEHQPSHILILGGTNDLWFGLNDELILSNIHAMRRQARCHDVIPIVGIPTPSVNLNELNMVHENYSECIRSFQNALIKYCEEDKQAYINFSLNMNDVHFLDDGIHPNEKGQELMMNKVKDVLLNL